jgi:hypothetical protein
MYKEMEEIFQNLTSHYRKIVLHNHEKQDSTVVVASVPAGAPDSGPPNSNGYSSVAFQENAADVKSANRRSASFKVDMGPLSLSEEDARNLIRTAVGAAMSPDADNYATAGSTPSTGVSSPSPAITTIIPGAALSIDASPGKGFSIQQKNSTHTPIKLDYDCYSDLPAVLRFHTLADLYVCALLEIQSFVIKKQAEIVKGAGMFGCVC